MGIWEGTPICGSRHRLLRHAWVILAALLLPIVVPRSPAAAVAVAAPPPVNAVVLSATIERPSFSAEPITRPAQTIVAAAHVTANALAAQYHVDAGALRWANNLRWNTETEPGAPLLLPPSGGGLVRVVPGERPSQFASRLGMDPRILLDFNRLTSDAPLAAGRYLQVPVGVAPKGSLNADVFAPGETGVPEVIPQPSTGADGFDFGQCTWYVASKRDLSHWRGNARDWWAPAAKVRPEGRVPVAGSILVMDIGPWGHVAYVERVSPDGSSFEISEMNWGGNGGGWGRVDHRMMPTREPGIMGFIY